MLPMLADHKAFSYIVYLLYIMAVKHEEVGVTEQTEARLRQMKSVHSQTNCPTTPER